MSGKDPKIGSSRAWVFKKAKKRHSSWRYAWDLGASVRQQREQPACAASEVLQEIAEGGSWCTAGGVGIATGTDTPPVLARARLPPGTPVSSLLREPR